MDQIISNKKNYKQFVDEIWSHNFVVERFQLGKKFKVLRSSYFFSDQDSSISKNIFDVSEVKKCPLINPLVCFDDDFQPTVGKGCVVSLKCIRIFKNLCEVKKDVKVLAEQDIC